MGDAAIGSGKFHGDNFTGFERAGQGGANAILSQLVRTAPQ